MVKKAVVINGREILSEADFHNKISEVMNFPSYYGKNLDALWDVLCTDVERPVTLVWENADCSKASMEHSFARIVDLLNRVMAQDEEWGLDETFEVVKD